MVSTEASADSTKMKAPLSLICEWKIKYRSIKGQVETTAKNSRSNHAVKSRSNQKLERGTKIQIYGNLPTSGNRSQRYIGKFRFKQK